jgi:hypothetical protein
MARSRGAPNPRRSLFRGRRYFRGWPQPRMEMRGRFELFRSQELYFFRGQGRRRITDQSRPRLQSQSGRWFVRRSAENSSVCSARSRQGQSSRVRTACQGTGHRQASGGDSLRPEQTPKDRLAGRRHRGPGRCRLWEQVATTPRGPAWCHEQIRGRQEGGKGRAKKSGAAADGGGGRKSLTATP